VVQILAYLRADAAGRRRRTTPCSSGSHSQRGSSVTPELRERARQRIAERVEAIGAFYGFEP
jgi:hypothetical protein